MYIVVLSFYPLLNVWPIECVIICFCKFCGKNFYNPPSDVGVGLLTNRKCLNEINEII